MIGDVTQKRGSKAKAFTKKNSKGGSFKHVPKPKNGDPSGSDAETDVTADKMLKGVSKVGPGTKDRQNPREQQSCRSNKEGAHFCRESVNDWVSGKRSSYK